MYFSGDSMVKGIENIYAHGAKFTVVTLRGYNVSKINEYLLSYETSQYVIITMLAGYNNLKDDNFEQDLIKLKSSVSSLIYF